VKTHGQDHFFEKVVEKLYTWADNGWLAGEYPVLVMMHTENDLEIHKEVEASKLHRMPKVHDFLKMWQGSQNLQAAQKESCTQNKQMPSVEYISDTEVIVKATWSNF